MPEAPPERSIEPRLPGCVQYLIEAAVPPSLRDAVVGDFEEQFHWRCRGSRWTATLWLLWEVVASFVAWLRYWFTRSCSLRVVLAVLVGLAATGTGLVLLSREPVLAVLWALPSRWLDPVGWSVEGALVVAAAYLTARIARLEAQQAAWGFGAPLLVLPVGRYWLCDGVVGVSWLALKLALVAACVVVGSSLASGGHPPTRFQGDGGLARSRRA